MSNKILMDSDSIGRSITRLSYEILEKNSNSQDIVLIGIHNRGVPLAARIQKKICDISDIPLNQGSLDPLIPRVKCQQLMNIGRKISLPCCIGTWELTRS